MTASSRTRAVIMASLAIGASLAIASPVLGAGGGRSLDVQQGYASSSEAPSINVDAGGADSIFANPTPPTEDYFIQQFQRFEAKVEPYKTFIPLGTSVTLKNLDEKDLQLRYLVWDGSMEVTVNGAWLYDSIESAAAEHDLGTVLYDTPYVGKMLVNGEMVDTLPSDYRLVVLELTVHNVDAVSYGAQIGRSPDIFETQVFDPRLATDPKQGAFGVLATNSGTPFAPGHPDDNAFECAQGETITLTLGYWALAMMAETELEDGVALSEDVILRPGVSTNQLGPVTFYLTPGQGGEKADSPDAPQKDGTDVAADKA